MRRRNDKSIFALVVELSAMTPRLSTKGSLSRLGSLRRSLLFTKTTQLNASHVLVDHNMNKLTTAKRHWPGCDFLNPYLLQPCLMERFLILIAVLVGGNLRLSLQSIGLGISVRKVIGDDKTTVIWNPTQVFHHGITLLAETSECYLKSPIVPLPRKCEKFVGVEMIGEVYGLSSIQFAAHTVDHRITSKQPRIGIYLSNLDVNDERETRLLRFAEFLLLKEKPLKIFLHYRNRSLPLHPKLAEFPHEIVSLADSLFALSSEQVSISGMSTVGLELASLSDNHFFCIGGKPDVFGRDRSVTPLHTFLSSLPHSLKTSQNDDDWIAQITSQNVELRRVFEAELASSKRGDSEE